MDKETIILKLYNLMAVTSKYSLDSEEAKTYALDIFNYMGIADNPDKCKIIFESYKQISKDLVSPETIDFKNSAIDFWYDNVLNIINQ